MFEKFKLKRQLVKLVEVAEAEPELTPGEAEAVGRQIMSAVEELGDDDPELKGRAMNALAVLTGLPSAVGSRGAPRTSKADEPYEDDEIDRMSADELIDEAMTGSAPRSSRWQACPKCGHDVFWVNDLLKIWKVKAERGFDCQIYRCDRCGYVEWYATGDDLEIADGWERLRGRPRGNA